MLPAGPVLCRGCAATLERGSSAGSTAGGFAKDWDPRTGVWIVGDGAITARIFDLSD